MCTDTTTEAEMPAIEVIIPPTDTMVLAHHEGAKAAIARMSPSRRYGAETNLRSWRRVLTAIDPRGRDGHAFVGHAVAPGALVSLPIGALIITVDTSWAKARWYADDHIAPVETFAHLYRVERSGPIQLGCAYGRTWAQDLLGFLMTNERIREEGRIDITGRA